MAEPEQLIRGKRFQALIQEDFRVNIQDGRALHEKHMSFEKMAGVRQKFGRMDILVDELDDFVHLNKTNSTSGFHGTMMLSNCV